MGVTDTQQSPSVTTVSRNAGEREKPYGEYPPYKAVANGEVCGRCFGRLEPGEAVFVLPWAAYWVERLGRYVENLIGARCANCGAPFGLRRVYGDVWTDGYGIRYYLERPCVTCGRPVFRDRAYVRKYVACCDGCRKANHNRVRRERRRARARDGKACDVCGESFTATRADAKTCSSACKQKAYRRRRKEVAA
jgi:hypothetical protein